MSIHFFYLCHNNLYILEAGNSWRWVLFLSIIYILIRQHTLKNNFGRHWNLVSHYTIHYQCTDTMLVSITIIYKSLRRIPVEQQHYGNPLFIFQISSWYQEKYHKQPWSVFVWILYSIMIFTSILQSFIGSEWPPGSFVSWTYIIAFSVDSSDIIY